MKKDKQNSFTGNLKSISERASKLRDFPEDFVIQEAENIEKSAAQLEEAWSGYRNLLFVLTLLLLISGIIIGYLAVSKRDIRESNLISTSSTMDSIKNIILNQQTKNDSVSISYYQNSDGKIITYSNAIYERDSLRKEIIELEDSLSSLKFDLDYIKSTYGIKISKKRDGKNVNLSISSTVLENYKKENEELSNSINQSLKIIKNKINRVNPKDTLKNIK